MALEDTTHHITHGGPRVGPPLCYSTSANPDHLSRIPPS